MKKVVLRMAGGVLVAAFAGGLFAVSDIPQVEFAKRLGGFILSQSIMAYEDGQGGQSMLAEVLGGEAYFYGPEKGEEAQALVLAENERETQDGAESSSDPIPGDVYDQGSAQTLGQPVSKSDGVRTANVYVEKLKRTLDTNYLLKKFYIVDSTTSVTKNLFDARKLLETDLTLAKKKGKKQILIYHTHGASEYFSDSRKNKIEDSIVGVGTELARELEKKGYGVYHDKRRYDLINGRLERSIAYNKALEGVQAIKESYPDIQVLIDLHRDSVGKGKHTYTDIYGKKTAIVMFFNGLSRNKSRPISYLFNPNLQANLSFSLQLKCKAMEYYDGFTKPIYLKGYRYNLHLAKRSLLIELGNENNTVQEAKNAAAPLADILDKVLSGRG